MANVSIISYGLVDSSGGRKTFPIYIAASASDAQIQQFIVDFTPDLDAAIDAKISDVSVTKVYSLPVGLKGAAISGNTVREGALLSYDADNTTYRFSHYVPSWRNAGFSGNTVNNTGAYATLIADLADGPASGADIDPSDRDANDLVSYIGGERAFRK